MKEILPGVFHWTTFHEGIRAYVHSCYVSATDPAVLIDPRVPAQGLGWFEQRAVPRHAYLTNRHHYRHSGQFAARFGTQIWCHKDGLHEFTKGERVHAFHHGDSLPGGIEALEVGSLCPEETALYIPVAEGILALGDSIVREGDRLCFVPDEYMGDDPEGVKRGMHKAFLRLLERDFDHLVLAHGKPWIGGAKAGLRKFIEGLGF